MPTADREQNRLQGEITQGIGDYYQAKEGDKDLEADDLREKFADLFRPLDNALEALPDPKQAELDLLAKLATMVHLAKSYGYTDYPAVDALTSVVIAKVIQRLGVPGVSLQHEVDEGDPYFDVIRLLLKNQTGKNPSVHPSRRGEAGVPDINTPLPLLKPEVVEALKDVIPSEEVERPTHKRYYSRSETENLWRLAARAEYLITLKKLQKAGIDLVAIASHVLEDASPVEQLSNFLDENSELSAQELAEKWGGETYIKPKESDMQKALRRQDQLARDIKSQSTQPDYHIQDDTRSF